MEKNKSICKYGVLVFDKDADGDEISIIHIVVYEEKPTDEDVNQLREEFSNEEAFGLSGTENLGFIVVELIKGLSEEDINDDNFNWSDYLPEPIPMDDMR